MKKDVRLCSIIQEPDTMKDSTYKDVFMDILEVQTETVRVADKGLILSLTETKTNILFKVIKILSIHEVSLKQPTKW